MVIKEFIELTNNVRHGGYQTTRPRIECRDGFTMSVQAGDGIYCCPRVSGSPAYYSVEIGFPSEKEDLIMQYAENEEHPTDTVYGYVPIDTVQDVIAKHGGMDDLQMLETVNSWRKKHNIELGNAMEELHAIRMR